jgi:hypothetical protein
MAKDDVRAADVLQHYGRNLASKCALIGWIHILAAQCDRTVGQ